MAPRTREQIEAEIKRRVDEGVAEALEKHQIEQKPSDLAAVLEKLASVMEKQADIDDQRNQREDLLFKASTKEFVERPKHDPNTFNIMKAARDRAAKLGYHLGPWFPVEQKNDSPFVESLPFWYFSRCQHTGAECQVRWNPPPKTTNARDDQVGWYPSMFGRAVSKPRYGVGTALEQWAKLKGLPSSQEFMTGGGMNSGGMGSGHSVDGVHDS